MEDVWHDEGDEEAQYIIIEAPAPNLLNPGAFIQLKDLDSAAPRLVVNSVTYQGQYEDSLTSTMMYQKRGDSYQYLCHTEKRLRFDKPQEPMPPTMPVAAAAAADGMAVQATQQLQQQQQQQPAAAAAATAAAAAPNGTAGRHTQQQQQQQQEPPPAAAQPPAAPAAAAAPTAAQQ